ncbi:MAG: hypothetical protein R2705_10105 [Ilumatobacteraceae bacterium]
MTQPDHRHDWRSTFELAALCAVIAVAVTVTLASFVGVGEMWLVLGTIVAASFVGFRRERVRALATVPVEHAPFRHPSMY